jgi:hypothetical protein
MEGCTLLKLETGYTLDEEEEEEEEKEEEEGHKPRAVQIKLFMFLAYNHLCTSTSSERN